MRILSTLAVAMFAAATLCPAQTINSPLGQPLTSPNQGNIGGGIYFNVTFNTTVTWVNLNYVAADQAAAGTSSLEMFVGPSQWQGNVAV
ncbi:MAG: hypothetical protein ABIP94_13030, partial [Planctomycetota bacterium]